MRNQRSEPTIVADLMTEDVITIHLSEKVGRARDLLIGLGFHALPVVENDTVVGIVTSTDLVDDWPEEAPVADVMTASPYRISADASIEEAAEEMLDHQVHHLVVDGARGTAGILSSFDLLRALLPNDNR